MPAGDLKEELKNTISMSFITSDDFYESLKRIFLLSNPAKLIENTYQLSLNKTWDNRAENIKKIISKQF